MTISIVARETSLMPAGTYYVGDLGYLLTGKAKRLYDEYVYADIYSGKAVSISVDDEKAFSAFYSHTHNSWIKYGDSKRNSYKVRNGIFGVVELLSQDLIIKAKEVEASGTGQIIEFSDEFEAGFDEYGTFTFGSLSVIGSFIDEREASLMPAGTYYVGDLCYLLAGKTDPLYDALVLGFDNDNTAVDVRAGRREAFAAFYANTAYGDGGYSDNEGNIYGVDAGILGVVQLLSADLLAKAKEEDAAGMAKVIDFPEDFRVDRDEDGTFTFGHLTIVTDESDQEDDSWDEDRWDEEDEDELED